MKLHCKGFSIYASQANGQSGLVLGGSFSTLVCWLEELEFFEYWYLALGACDDALKDFEILFQ